MSNRIFALLVGINDYPAHVGRLAGCLNDVDHFSDYLRDHFDRSLLRIQTLKDADATRENIIGQFRDHLATAGKDDIVVFQYCGHGARSASAAAFHEFFPAGKDEGLVCFDSRDSGKYDLADKELAVLLAEVAKNDPHIAVILDCCHSGTATRGADDFTQLQARQTDEVFAERPLESYLDGHYQALLQRGEPLEIPASSHILLAACKRFQKAWEGKDQRGVFTSTILEVLDKSGPGISYSELFVRCRAAVRKRADNQDPQFGTYRGFNAYAGFLGAPRSHHARRYSVCFDDNHWHVNCGAMHGLPSDPDLNVELALYAESDQSRLAGHAATTQVGPQESQLELLDIDADPSTHFQAEITSLPVPPLMVALEGDREGTESLQKFLMASDRTLDIAFLSSEEVGARYTFTAENNRFLLTFRATGKLIQGARGYTRVSADYMFGILQKVAAWERAVHLQNDSSQMDPDCVPFKFCEMFDDDQQFEYPTCEITFDIDERNSVRGTLKAKNLSHQPLHLMLVHFAEDYCIQPLYHERVECSESEFTVTLDGNAEFEMALAEDEGDEAIHTFKLIVSSEQVDDFFLEQDPIELGEIVDVSASRELRLGRSRKKIVHKHEWFTKDLHLKLVRQLDRVTDRDATIANGRITVKGHPSLQAGISLCAAKIATKGVGMGSDIYRVMERQGMEMLSFSDSRGGGDTQNILELTDIQNPQVLQEHPVQIELDINLAADESILPLIFDGEQILVAGDSSRDDNGKTLISIDHIPDVPDNRRSSGGALKLYFFKTDSRRTNFPIC